MIGDTGRMISYPAPALCQGSDVEVLLHIGSIVFPERIKRDPSENGLRIWIEGDPKDIESGIAALAQFQIVLGILRAWKTEAGQLADEQRRGLGKGSVRDEMGKQYFVLGSVISYNFPDDVEPLAVAASSGVQNSEPLRNSLWLNGRQGRTSADFYMIYEYAQRELHGTAGINAKLGLSRKLQQRLTNAANNLSPLEGGRHATGQVAACMTLDEQADFISDLLRSWILLYSLQ